MENLKNELAKLKEQIKKIDEDTSVYYALKRELDIKVEEKNKEIFIASNVLSEIGWIINIGKSYTLYLVPDHKSGYNKEYSDWSDKFFESYNSGWSHHYQFEVKSAKVIVNDHDIEVSAIKGKTILDVIKDFNIKITQNKISEKKQELESALKKVTETENFLKTI